MVMHRNIQYCMTLKLKSVVEFSDDSNTLLGYTIYTSHCLDIDIYFMLSIDLLFIVALCIMPISLVFQLFVICTP